MEIFGYNFYIVNKEIYISIVTPSYNQVKYLGEALRSVEEQDYPASEHLVIDGGSDDGSADVLRACDDFLAYWVSEKDDGQTHAINKGMAKTSGEILAYLNSDDYYLPGCFQAVAEAYAANPDADLFVGRCLYVNEHGERIGSQFGSITNYEQALDLWNYWWKRKQFVQPEVFWTRRIAEKIGPFTESLHYVMDYDFWTRALKAGAKVAFIDRELTAFRFTPDQKSNQSEAVADELLALVKPWIWDTKSPIGIQTRQRLKASWEYHGGFLRLRDRLVAEGVGRGSRCLSLARYLATHPRVFTSPSMRATLREIFSFRRQPKPD